MPSCSLFVHHGGGGTVHAACRAGVAQVIFPQLFDQPSWAERISWLGLGSRVDSMGMSEISSAVARALAPATAAACQLMKQGMAGEDGVGVAADVIVEAAMNGVG